MRKIILASGSPRRKELLANLGVEFEVIPSDFDEWLDDSIPPEETAVVLGLGKARAVAKRYPDAIVIGSDTIVTINDKQLAKAENEEEALGMWRLLAGKPNKVTTSVAVVCKAENYEFSTYDNTLVFFKPFEEEAVRQYLAQNTYQDKAGAYAIQDHPHLIDHYEGDIETVIGLPTRLLLGPLADFGILPN